MLSNKVKIVIKNELKWALSESMNWFLVSRLITHFDVCTLVFKFIKRLNDKHFKSFNTLMKKNKSKAK